MSVCWWKEPKPVHPSLSHLANESSIKAPSPKRRRRDSDGGAPESSVDERGRLEDQMAQAAELIANLIDDKSKLQAQVTVSHVEKDDLMVKVEQVALNIEAELEKDKVELKQEPHQDTAVDFEELNNRVADLEDALSKAKTELSNSLQKCENLGKEAAAKDEVLGGLRAEKESVECNLSALQQSHSETEMEWVDLCDRLEQENDALKKQVQAAQKEKEEAKIKQLESKNQSTGLQSDILQRDQENKMLKDKLLDQEELISKWKVTRITRGVQCVDLQSDIQKLDEENKMLKKDQEKLISKWNVTKITRGVQTEQTDEQSTIEELKARGKESEHDFFCYLQTRDETIYKLKEQLAQTQQQLVSTAAQAD